MWHHVLFLSVATVVAIIINPIIITFLLFSVLNVVLYLAFLFYSVIVRVLLEIWVMLALMEMWDQL